MVFLDYDVMVMSDIYNIRTKVVFIILVGFWEVFYPCKGIGHIYRCLDAYNYIFWKLVMACIDIVHL